MSKPKLNLAGQKFGKLFAVERVVSDKGRTKFICTCDCGNQSTVAGSDLVSGNTTSCGCVKAKTGLTSNLLHGGASGEFSGAYRSWRSMKQRCLNPSSRGWSEYGAKGVKVCDRWLTYENFVSDMGERPEGYSLERLDVFGDYTPENCKWIPVQEQARNKRNTVRYLYEGKVVIQAELARLLGLHSTSLTSMRRQNRLPAGIKFLET